MSADITITAPPNEIGAESVVSEREVDRAHPLDVAELLNRIPGVIARQDHGAGGRLDISIRGLDAGRSRRVLVLEDGIPIAINPYGEPDLYYSTPIERVRSIRVIKGAADFSSGPQSVGGVIDFTTFGPRADRSFVVDVEGGDRAYARGLLRYGDARFSASAFHSSGDGVRKIAFTTTDAFAKIAIDELVLKIGFHDEGGTSDAVGLTRAIYANDPRTTTLAPNDASRLRRYEISLHHRHPIDESTTLHSIGYAYTLTRIWRRQRYSRDLAPGAAVERIVGDPSQPGEAIYFLRGDTVLDRTYEVAAIEERIEHRRRIGPIDHALSAGARFLVETARYDQRLGDTPTSFAGVSSFAEAHRTFGLALYAQDRFAIGDAFAVNFGARLEHAWFRRSILRATDQTGTHDVDISGQTEMTALIPGIGVVIGPRKANVFANVRSGFSPPRVSSAISPRGVPAQLGSERSIDWELGARASPTRFVRAEVTGFLSVFRNQIVVDATSDGAAETDAGRTLRHGLESTLVLSIGKALASATTIDLAFRHTFQRATYASTGNLLPYAPMQTGGVTLDVERAGISGQIAASFVSSQFSDSRNTVLVDPTGTIGKIPAYTTVDAGVGYRHAKSGLSFRVSIKNAFDTVHVISRRPEGIFAEGFRQIVFGARWDYESRTP